MTKKQFLKGNLGICSLLAGMLFFSSNAFCAGNYTAGGSPDNYQETTIQKGTYNDRATKGFDPTTIVCVDANGNGWIDQGECSWGSTSTPWFADPALDTQKGNNVTPGGSSASLGQTTTTTVSEPHFKLNYFNAPSAANTTATSGVTSGPSGNLRAQHNEFGFEVVVDKKTDPLEPYYLKFSVPNITVDSTQSSTTGDMTGTAAGEYAKEITEMNPNNPGVFYRYTVTGTFTSESNSFTSSTCTSGCTNDNEAQWRAQWP
ncbi:MAG: hypothetical protein HZA08_04360 [Nitrospirae bacterium]|nr:hypothetical protein [Nitrospirota bacterium]